jgi:murein DD-endopeptidase MepM/ murein hydrolase activator NlpD
MFGMVIARSAFLALGGLYGALTGPRDLETYPDPAESPYQLPYQSGVAWWCTQSNRGIVSHHGPGKQYAWDFSMPVGTKICAARGGTVVRVVAHHEKRGSRQPNNLVTIDHGDGTQASYLHLRRGGSLVEVGQVVAPGEIIAESGNVGRSLAPHLHFHVRQGAATIPISFRDVRRHRGVPRLGFRYRAD